MTFKLSEKEIKKTIKEMKEHAEMMLHKEGEVPGIIDAYNAKGQNLMVPMLYRDMNEKQHMFLALKHVFKKAKVVCFFMLTEAWMVKGSLTKDEDPERYKETMEAAHNQELHLHPDKIEVVIIQYIAHKGARTEIYPMLRSKKGKFRGLGEPEKIDDEKLGEGMIADMLPPLEKEENDDILSSDIIQ